MPQEQFLYKERVVQVEAVQPLFADGWLWRITIDGQMQRCDHQTFQASPQQALTCGRQEAMGMVDSLYPI